MGISWYWSYVTIAGQLLWEPIQNTIGLELFEIITELIEDCVESPHFCKEPYSVERLKEECASTCNFAARIERCKWGSGFTSKALGFSMAPKVVAKPSSLVALLETELSALDKTDEGLLGWTTSGYPTRFKILDSSSFAPLHRPASVDASGTSPCLLHARLSGADCSWV